MKTKYKKSYAEDLLRYFFKFIEMRDNPDDGDAAEKQGLYLLEPDVDDVYKTIPAKPCTGIPTLTKFAIMKGVTIQTLENWRKKYKEFGEACNFADAIQNDILDERALFSKVDGKVAMKIRELKAASRKEAINESESGRRFSINIVSHIAEEQSLKLGEWSGEVTEDESYKPSSD